MSAPESYVESRYNSQDDFPAVDPEMPHPAASAFRIESSVKTHAAESPYSPTAANSTTLGLFSHGKSPPISVRQMKISVVPEPRSWFP
jgi:hypothetical protein